MGTWGAALYDDDEAGDLKDAIALLAKVPIDGDRMLALLKRLHDVVDPLEAEDSLFWLVAADQFEKKGIACREAVDIALRVIESGSDFADFAARGADEKLLEARRKMLLSLEGRLRHPRPAKPPRKAGRPPPLVLETGQVFAFPTMSGRAWHPYRPPSAGPFVPDGWGALIVLAAGRAFDWLPWVALAGSTVDIRHKPSLEEALNGRIVPHPQTDGVGRYVPKAAHAKGLGLDLLGTVGLDNEKVKPHLSKWSIETAIQYDWSIAYGALTSSAAGEGAEAGVILRALCRGDA